MAQKRGRSLDIGLAKKKLNELFITWLTMPETQELVNGILARYEGDDNKSNADLGTPKDKGVPPPQICVQSDNGSLGGLDMRVSPPPLDALSPHSPIRHPHIAKLKVVDEWDRLRSKVASPPSSPKPGQGSPTTHPPAPLSPHGHKSHATHASMSPSNAAGTSKDMQASLEAIIPSSSSSGARSPTSPSRSQNGPLHCPPVEQPATASLIPQFWFPNGKELSKAEMEKESKTITAAFRVGPKTKAAKGAKPVFRTFKLQQGNDWVEFVSKVLGFPGWWANQIFTRLTKPSTEVTHKMFREWWDKEVAHLPKERRFFNFLKNDSSRDYLVKKDFEPFVQDLLNIHPGLEFLKQTPEFQEKYAETVVVRIFYTVNRCGNGKLTFKEYQRSRLQETMLLLDTEDDINNVTDFFSYEHFYVLYCKFWELDGDHDFYISKDDLLKYNNYSMTETIVDVIFQGVPRKMSSDQPGKMNYEDFIWFCLSEEDKTSDTSLEYWFRCVDLDRDGIISGYELDYFYAEQKKRMETFLTEQILFDDILCQMIDMINPQDPKYIRLSDIKVCPTSGIFFNVLFNLNKFIGFEQRDPFQAHAEKQGPERTDWDRFARIEYDRMAMEAEQSEEYSEGGAEAQEWGMGI